MNLVISDSQGLGYSSSSQRARVITETWVSGNAFCPNCGLSKVEQYPNNRPVADFHCTNCREEYELKSKQGVIGAKIVDGAYSTMIQRLESLTNPNLFLLSYDNFKVHDFLVVPKYFFVPEIIERRKALSQSAHRAGWVGCNILLSAIPESGKVFIVKSQTIQSKEKVLNAWRKTSFLKTETDSHARGWLVDVMACVEDLKREAFKLDEVYAYEDRLKKLHPNNNHIKDKVRQQLQILRDKGYLEFMGNGTYKLI